MGTELRFVLLFLVKTSLVGYLLTSGRTTCARGGNRARALKFGEVILTLVNIKVIASLGAPEQGPRTFKVATFLYHFSLLINNLSQPW